MSAKIIKVKRLEIPLRLDKYLKEKLKTFSRQQIIRAIKEKKILVNHLQVKPSFTLKGGERIYLTPELFKEKRKNKIFPVLLTPEPSVIYEDKHLLALNKPAGIAVHPTLDTLSRITLAHWLIYKYPFLKKVGEDPLRPGIVHRLDKDTSGVLLVAKDNPTFHYLKNLFQKHQIKKQYLALVWGYLKKERGKITFPLTRSAHSTFRRKIVLEKKVSEITPTASNKIKNAITEFQVIQRFSQFTLLKVFPQTGRTHQIRVHLASIGFPIVGDKEYGPQKRKLPFPLSRHFLHAQKTSLFLPEGTFLEIEAPLPQDLQKALSFLES